MENLKVKQQKYTPKSYKLIKEELEFQDNYEALNYIEELEKKVSTLKRQLVRNSLLRK